MSPKESETRLKTPTSPVLRGLIIPDVHAPYHDGKAYACLKTVAKKWRPDVAVCLGDFADFVAVSSHPKDPSRILPFPEEVAGVNVALDELDSVLARCPTKYYLEGNHETRLERYMLKQAPEVRNWVDWRDMLRLDQRGWRVTPYKSSLELGHLTLTHDLGRCGMHAAKESLNDLGKSVAFGHTHRMQVIYQGKVAGDRHVGATLGWLGDPEAIDYRHRDMVRRDWQHGFGVVYWLANGEFWLNAIPIINGRCVLEGKIYGQ